MYINDIKRKIKNIQRFVFIWISWKCTNLKWQRGLQRCVPNEHLDHKKKQFFDFFSWRSIIFNDSDLSNVFWIQKSLFFSSCINPLYLNRFLQVFNPSNLLVNLSCPLRIFNLDCSFFIHFFKRNISSLHQSLLD